MSPEFHDLITWLSWLEEEPGWEKKDDPPRPAELVREVFGEGHIPAAATGPVLRALRLAMREKGHTNTSAADLLARLRSRLVQ